MSAREDGTAPVSVILPVHNGGRFLRASVESILAQTLRDLELIVVDDGSTDGAIEALGISDPRLRVLRQENRGLVASLNRGLDEARHDLVARMDADDVSRVDRLELQVAYLSTHPEVAAVGCCYDVVDEQEATVAEIHVAAAPGYQRRRLCFRNVLPHPGMTFRRRAVLDVGGYRDVGPAEDYDLWVRLSARNGLAALPEPLLRYRETSTGISRQATHRQLQAQRAVRSRLLAERPLRDLRWRTVLGQGHEHVTRHAATCTAPARTYAFDHAWLTVLMLRRLELRTAAHLALGLAAFLVRHPAGAVGVLDLVPRRGRRGV